MTYEEFDELFEKRVERLREIGRTKGKKYTKASGDRLANFYEEAEQLEQTPIAIWYIFFNKHFRVLEAYVTGRNTDITYTDLIEEHLTDSIMYLFLLEGLITNAIREEHSGV